MLRLTLLAVIASTGTARGDDASEANGKSMSVAMGLSAGGTAAGLALATLGVASSDLSRNARTVLFGFGATAALVMPIAGHWYARGSVRDGSLGSYVRLAGGCILVIGGIGWLTEEHSPDSHETSIDVETAVIYGGLGVLAAGAIIDIARTPAAVRRANRRPARVIDIAAVSPTPVHHGAGFALSGRF